MKQLARIIAVCWLACLLGHVAWAQSILPSAETQFTDANGAPYGGGSVFFYIPGTSTPATTWQDSGLTTPNTNPVVLDSAGRARIWGNACYRQVLYDINSVLVWDQITCSALTPTSVTGSGLVVLQNNPTIDTPTINTPNISNPTVTGNLIAPSLYGGTLQNSTLGVRSTNNASPSGDSIVIQADAISAIGWGGVSNLTIGSGSSAGTLTLANQNLTGGMNLIAGGTAAGTATLVGGNYILGGLSLVQTWTAANTFSSTFDLTGLTAVNQTTLLSIGAGGQVFEQSTTGTGAAVLATTPAITNPTLGGLTNGLAGGFFLCYNNSSGVVEYDNSACNSSDERLKHDWKHDVPGLEAIMALRPGTFDWRDAADGSERQMGLKAQDVQKLLPEVVSVGGDRTIKLADGSTEEIKGVLGLDYGKLTLPLIIAVQEQQKELQRLMVVCGLMLLMLVGLFAHLIYRRVR